MLCAIDKTCTAAFSFLEEFRIFGLMVFLRGALSKVCFDTVTFHLKFEPLGDKELHILFLPFPSAENVFCCFALWIKYNKGILITVNNFHVWRNVKDIKANK